MTAPTFPFPIPSLINIPNLKNIPTSALLKFYDLITEDPDTFLFEFDILCRSFDYNSDSHKLKLFPTTLKDSALRWFMGLRENAVTDWVGMRDLFQYKYKEYCKGGDL